MPPKDGGWPFSRLSLFQSDPSSAPFFHTAAVGSIVIFGNSHCQAHYNSATKGRDTETPFMTAKNGDHDKMKRRNPCLNNIASQCILLGGQYSCIFAPMMWFDFDSRNIFCMSTGTYVGDVNPWSIY